MVYRKEITFYKCMIQKPLTALKDFFLKIAVYGILGFRFCYTTRENNDFGIVDALNLT